MACPTAYLHNSIRKYHNSRLIECVSKKISNNQINKKTTTHFLLSKIIFLSLKPFTLFIFIKCSTLTRSANLLHQDSVSEVRLRFTDTVHLATHIDYTVGAKLNIGKDSSVLQVT